MPSIAEQFSNSDAFTTNFTVCRALTVPGRTYEETVAVFKPYSRIHEPNWDVRNALRDLLVRSKQRAEPAYIFVNNRLEGFAPGTIAGVLSGVWFDVHVKRLRKPIRRFVDLVSDLLPSLDESGGGAHDRAHCIEVVAHANAAHS
jgi:hypothetical protein